MIKISKQDQDPSTLPTLESTTRELSNVRHALDKSAIVAITDRVGNIIHVNDKFCEISQYSREELLGQNHRLINSGHHSREFFVEMWKTISSGTIWEGELRNRAKGGSIYWVNTTIVPFLDDKKQPYQYVSIRYEITQRKEAEEQLRVFADRLEQSNRELQDFASIAAHDLQEPLRKIHAFGDRLQTRFGAVLDNDGRDYLERMLSSARRMRKLIDDLLTYSRVTTKVQPLEPTDLNQVLKEVLSDLEIRIEQAKGKIERGPLPTLDADSSQMRQLFQNLIANALKFHRPGFSPVVKITAKSENGFCIVTVDDNGIGFDEKYLDKIFTIFQRLHGRQEYEGTGVGLAVCRRIAERHGGTINAHSKPGEGARFVVKLPIRH
jgi:two-component system, LuxR family, sensor kinase FixL